MNRTITIRSQSIWILLTPGLVLVSALFIRAPHEANFVSAVVVFSLITLPWMFYRTIWAFLPRRCDLCGRPYLSWGKRGTCRGCERALAQYGAPLSRQSRVVPWLVGVLLGLGFGTWIPTDGLRIAKSSQTALSDYVNLASAFVIFLGWLSLAYYGISLRSRERRGHFPMPRLTKEQLERLEQFTDPSFKSTSRETCSSCGVAFIRKDSKSERNPKCGNCIDEIPRPPVEVPKEATGIQTLPLVWILVIITFGIVIPKLISGSRTAPQPPRAVEDPVAPRLHPTTPSTPNSMLLVGGAIVVLCIFTVNWRKHRPGSIRSQIRKACHWHPRKTKCGPLTVWSNDSVEELKAELPSWIRDTSQSFERLTGLTTPVDTPYEVFILVGEETCRAATAFTKSGITEVLAWYSTRPISLMIPYEGPNRIPQSLETRFKMLMLDVINIKRGNTSLSVVPTWLRPGVCCEALRAEGYAPLNDDRRSLKLSLKRGTWLRPHEFEWAPDTMLADWNSRAQDLAFLRKRLQFQQQSRATLEYLIGPEAPQENLGRFKAFLGDLATDQAPDIVFRRHFGFGFVDLGYRVREWVSSRPDHPTLEPTSGFDLMIRQYLLPLIQDPKAPIKERDAAVTEFGILGFEVRAEVLRSLIESQSELSRPNLIMAWESMTGKAYDPIRSYEY